MLEKFIEKILSLAPIQTEEINGNTYSKYGLVKILPPELEEIDTAVFYTLHGLVEFATQRAKDINHDVYCHVNGAETVSLMSGLIKEAGNTRFKYAEARYPGITFDFGGWLDLEMFIISMQSQFVKTDDLELIISNIGMLANENIIQHNDDGMSQSIQVKTGLTTKSNVKVKNPVSLCPYRTFREIEQPIGDFILRFRKGIDRMTCALFEADGGSWRIEAIKNIKAYLMQNLPEKIKVIG